MNVDALRRVFSGRLTLPTDSEYDARRAVFNAMIDRRPAIIASCETTADVAEAIAFARSRELVVAVRGGGHSVSGLSVCEGGIVLHLGDLRSFDIDADGRAAWAGSGLTAAAYTNAAGARGLATGFGDTGSVGIGGITLGGGIGFLSRKYGLTIDSLLGAEIVTADGELLHVQNWIDCVRSRKPPTAPAEAGVSGAAAAHMANIALRTGQTAIWKG